METVREAIKKGELKVGNMSCINKNTNVNTTNVSPFEDGTLIRLYEYGHDMSGKFAHINVSYGMVDVRKTRSKFYHKNENGVWEGIREFLLRNVLIILQRSLPRQDLTLLL